MDCFSPYSGSTYFKHKSTQKISKCDIMRIYKRGNMLCDANLANEAEKSHFHGFELDV